MNYVFKLSSVQMALNYMSLLVSTKYYTMNNISLEL
jgi:hypothetical protein